MNIQLYLSFDSSKATDGDLRRLMHDAMQFVGSEQSFIHSYASEVIKLVLAEFDRRAECCYTLNDVDPIVVKGAN